LYLSDDRECKLSVRKGMEVRVNKEQDVKVHLVLSKMIDNRHLSIGL
jgi:hypothetical protein